MSINITLDVHCAVMSAELHLSVFMLSVLCK